LHRRWIGDQEAEFGPFARVYEAVLEQQPVMGLEIVTGIGEGIRTRGLPVETALVEGQSVTEDARLPEFFLQFQFESDPWGAAIENPPSSSEKA